MMRAFLVIFILAFFGMVSLQVLSGDNSVNDDPVTLERQLLARSSARLSLIYNFRCIGIGESVDGKIRMLGLSFECHRQLEKAEARRLLLTCVEDFLKDINSDDKLRPHLRNIPFTDKDIRFSIHFSYPDGNDVHTPLICSAFVSRGTVFFSTLDPHDPYKFYNENETFEEAVRIVESEKAAGENNPPTQGI